MHYYTVCDVNFNGARKNIIQNKYHPSNIDKVIAYQSIPGQLCLYAWHLIVLYKTIIGNETDSSFAKGTDSACININRYVYILSLYMECVMVYNIYSCTILYIPYSSKLS